MTYELIKKMSVGRHISDISYVTLFKIFKYKCNII